MDSICFGRILISETPGAGRRIPAVSQGGPHRVRTPLKKKKKKALTGLEGTGAGGQAKSPGLVPSTSSLLPVGHGQMMCEASREAPSLAGSLLCSRGSSAVILALTPDNLVLSRTGPWFLGKQGAGGHVSQRGWEGKSAAPCDAQSKLKNIKTT